MLVNSVAAMGIRRQIRAGALTPDDRELQARLVNALNELQSTNERCRGLLLDGNLDGLVTMGRKVSDLGVVLMLTARDGGAVIEPAQLTFDEHVYDPRELAAGKHLEEEREA